MREDARKRKFLAARGERQGNERDFSRPKSRLNPWLSLGGRRETVQKCVVTIFAGVA